MEVRKLPVDMVHVEQLQLKKVVAIVLLPMSTIRDELARLGLGCVRDLRRSSRGSGNDKCAALARAFECSIGGGVGRHSVCKQATTVEVAALGAIALRPLKLIHASLLTIETAPFSAWRGLQPS